eukprot:TRINITY_DN18645_c0_g1_i1.p3 TRINITY_DN18645_c0_g1~~TRINITY_DN18645_c0_g1_i1.p3  ORF type:complete len:192 (-),score=29.73 TRINITY_DN18645_c0_g1_i1:667-1242(-)
MRCVLPPPINGNSQNLFERGQVREIKCSDFGLLKDSTYLVRRVVWSEPLDILVAFVEEPEKKDEKDAYNEEEEEESDVEEEHMDEEEEEQEETDEDIEEWMRREEQYLWFPFGEEETGFYLMIGLTSFVTAIMLDTKMATYLTLCVVYLVQISWSCRYCWNARPLLTTIMVTTTTKSRRTAIMANYILVVL